ncbi:hypothetical protein [Hahella sp. NBU794]|uniref:hypothetical protein n=1 Tax=Hahella sp. NBU794 TaxID=3422590 RepID=UPI003D6E258C
MKKNSKIELMLAQLAESELSAPHPWRTDYPLSQDELTQLDREELQRYLKHHLAQLMLSCASDADNDSFYTQARDSLVELIIYWGLGHKIKDPQVLAKISHQTTESFMRTKELDSKFEQLLTDFFEESLRQ